MRGNDVKVLDLINILIKVVKVEKDNIIKVWDLILIFLKVVMVEQE